MFTFPKIDLHLHLDGSLRPGTVLELARAQGVSLPFRDVPAYRQYIAREANCGSVNKYLELFDLPLSVIQDAESLARVTRELIETLAAQGLAYAEIRFAPQLHCRGGLDQSRAVEAVLEGRRQGLAASPGIGVGILLCMMCVGTEAVNWDENAETAALSAAYRDKGVVGLDLAGGEGIVPLKNFAPLFRGAAEQGVRITCHAGDSQGPDTVRDAMDMGAERIGHGHRIFDDPALCRRAAETGITLEICPTSNIQCRTQLSYGAHPAKRLLDMGVNVTINTDNMSLADVTLEDEYEHCLGEMGFTAGDLVRMSRCAVEASFMPEAEKEKLLAVK